jgi:hypothetical protein
MTWNSSDILLDDYASDGNNSSSANGTVVECACDSDGLFSVEVPLVDEPEYTALGMRCAISERQAISRMAVFVVTATGVVLSIATCLMIRKPLLIVDKAYSSRYWKILPQ